MLAFLATYLTIGGIAALGVGAFFVATSVRNRLVQVVAQAANIVCNPLATLAAQLRSFSDTVRDAVPDTAFAEGTTKRLVFVAIFFILIAVDAALAGERLAAIFGLEAAAPPFDISWATGLGWVIAGGLFASVSLDLRHEVIGHPFDRLAPRWHRPLRILSDCCFVAVVLSGLVFYVLGALLLAGSAPLILSILFMGLLGPSLIVASAIAGWAGMDSFASAYGVVLVFFSRLVRLAAMVPELIVISLRRTAYLTMALIDLPLLGAVWPLQSAWAKSRFGKALGFPVGETPIDWPPIGYVELPDELPESSAAPLVFPAGAEDEDDFEEAA